MKREKKKWHRTVEAKKTNNDPKFLLTYSELSRLLGISERKIWSMVKSDEIPVVRIGKLVRFKMADIERWLEANTTGGEYRERSK